MSHGSWVTIDELSKNLASPSKCTDKEEKGENNFYPQTQKCFTRFCIHFNSLSLKMVKCGIHQLTLFYDNMLSWLPRILTWCALMACFLGLEHLGILRGNIYLFYLFFINCLFGTLSKSKMTRNNIWFIAYDTG